MKGRILIPALALALLGACQQREGLLTEDVVSYRVTLKAPADLGSDDAPIMEDNPHQVVLDVEALGADGQVRSDVNADVNLWVFYQGTLSPVRDESGIATVTLAGGVARDVTRSLPLAYGPTTIWIDDVRRQDDGLPDCLGPYAPAGGSDSCSFATGASPTIHYRNPYLDEVQTPPDPTRPEATFTSSLQGKSVLVDHPRDPDGLLVVTGAYAQAFTVTDISPSAMARGYNHMYVYSYSRAKRNDHTAVTAGDIVVSCPGGACRGYLSGGVKEFVGFTELDFPFFDISPPEDSPECRCGLSFRSDGSRCADKVWAPCPEPVTLDPAWFNGLADEGDTADNLYHWTLLGLTPSNSTDGVVYGSFTHSGSDYIVALYQDPGRTTLVAQGQYTSSTPTWPQTVTLSGTSLSGSVWLSGYAADVDFSVHSDPTLQKLESLESALLRVRAPRVCLYNDTDWTTYGQFKVDVGSGCNLAVAAKGVAPGFDPQAAQGETLGEIIGTLRNVSDYSSSDPTQVYNIWVLNPRAAEDLDCGGAATGCTQ